jgi:hypothetical protein
MHKQWYNVIRHYTMTAVVQVVTTISSLLFDNVLMKNDKEIRNSESAFIYFQSNIIDTIWKPNNRQYSGKTIGFTIREERDLVNGY